MKAYILTESYSDYDKYGDYFIAWWSCKPSMEVLIEYFKGDKHLAKHIFNGGGQRNYEDSWYCLDEVEEGGH